MKKNSAGFSSASHTYISNCTDIREGPRALRCIHGSRIAFVSHFPFGDNLLADDIAYISFRTLQNVHFQHRRHVQCDVGTVLL